METTTKYTALIIAATMVACVVEDEPRPAQQRASTPAARHAVAVIDDPARSYEMTPKDAAELRGIVIDLAQRAAARGYTLQDMQDAVDSRDEDAAREILGMSAAEIAEVHERIQDIVNGRRDGRSNGDGPGRTRPWLDDPHVEIENSQCAWAAYAGCLWVSATSSVTPNLGTSLVQFILKNLVCICGFCEGGINDIICGRWGSEE